METMSLRSMGLTTVSLHDLIERLQAIHAERGNVPVLVLMGDGETLVPIGDAEFDDEMAAVALIERTEAEASSPPLMN